LSAFFLLFKEAATSKKFIMAVAGALTGALLKIGLDLPTEDVAAVLSPIIAYIVAQGWADRGAQAAKVNGTVALEVQAQQQTAASLPQHKMPQAVKDKLI